MYYICNNFDKCHKFTIMKKTLLFSFLAISINASAAHNDSFTYEQYETVTATDSTGIAEEVDRTKECGPYYLYPTDKRYPHDEPIYDVVEKAPSFPGGMKEVWKYISDNIKYPKELEEAAVQGRVVVSFVVSSQGYLYDAKVTKTICDELDQEALRVVRCMPKWEPGTQKGKNVNARFTLPISFRLY